MAKTCGCGCGHGDERRAEGARYTAETQVGDAARDPAVRAVLERFGLDRCCGGGLSLRAGAAAAGVPLDDLLAALNAPPVVTA